MSSRYVSEIASLSAERRPSGPELKIALHKLHSELSSRSTDMSPESFALHASAARALGAIRSNVHATVRQESLLSCVRFLHSNSKLEQAHEAAKAMRHLAQQCNDAHWLQLSEAALGVIIAEQGRVGEAIEHYARALDVPSHPSRESNTLGILNNLGVALNYASLYRDAIPCFKRVIYLSSLSTSEIAPLTQTQALCNLAQSYSYIENYELAFEAISRCLEASYRSMVSSPDSMVIRELTFVQIALELEKPRLAFDHILRCEGYAREAKTERAQFFLRMAKALYDVYAADAGRGVAALESALDSSLADIGMFRADALSALVRAYDHVNQPESALNRLNELMRFLRSTRERGIDALQSVVRPETGIGYVDIDSTVHPLEFRAARLRASVAERERDTSCLDMLERMAVTADLREEPSGEHGYRVGALSKLLANELGWDEDLATELERSARLHDIGKIGVPDHILFSTASLQAAQLGMLRMHTDIGAEILGRSPVRQLNVAHQVAKCHHEWWNGEGYPSKLSGKRIPIHARIVALADVFDALTHGRPFSPAWPVDRALAEIRSRRGTQFDPDLTDVFLNLIERLISEHEDLDAYLGRASRHSPFLQARNKIRRMLEDEREKERSTAAAAPETRH